MSTATPILLTGGAGFIGSHVCVELAKAGLHPVVLDNLCNSKASVMERLARIVGRTIDFVQGDIRDGALLRKVLADFGIRGVIHLAGLKAVGESLEQPLAYYENNVTGTLVLLQAMQEMGVRSMVFSSSAAVYGEPRHLPIDESHPITIEVPNPYGRTKLVIERMLRDLSHADERWRICLLRYFNPAGAHESGLIGEDPRDVPSNLLPFVLRVAHGELPELRVWGSDYPTVDGTGVRDYIHVVDLAIGHVRALEHLPSMRCEAINLGTGRGTSVLELVNAFERVNGLHIPRCLKPRRAGDVAACFADASLALRRLGWKTERTIEDMCRDAWRWQRSAGAASR